MRQGNFLRFIFKTICSVLLNSSCIDLYIPLKTPQITLRDRELHRSSLRIVGKTDTVGVVRAYSDYDSIQPVI